jgi:uncharacterized RDD family membrane protein YckC
MRPSGQVGPITATPAGFGPRVGAFIIDSAVVFIGLVLLSIVVYVVDPFTSRTTMNVLTWLVSAAYWTIGYSAVMRGQTLGKRAVNLRVVGMDSQEPISVWRALLRLVGALIAAIPFGLGYLWVLWDPDKRGWHDHIAGTRVLHTESQRSESLLTAPQFASFQPERAPCPRCGESIPVNARVCRYCGLEFLPPPSPPTSTSGG